MPADSPHINLCKAIMSALALGYPAPTILNWYGGFNRPEWHFSGSHVAKLESLLNVLDELLDGGDGDRGPSDPNDLILLVDGYDVWFQLPPSVLIERYHQLNSEADERNRKAWEASGAAFDDFPIPPPKQRIVVTPSKHCSPGTESGSNPHYEHWPASPMREDLYGDATDTVLPLWFDPARRYMKLRPRCVNSGFIMGTAEALRDVMQRAKEKIDEVDRSGRQIWSDQALLGEIIGEQEMWRIFMREAASSWDGFSSNMPPSFSDPDIRRIGEAALSGERFEFGIGLDYNFTTIPPTCSAEEDAFFVILGDEQAVQSESSKAGVPGPVRVHGVPPELSRVPFHPEGALHGINWNSVPLFTDFYFGNTPVGIHHNAYINNSKATRLRDWWSKMWFYPRLRELLTANLRLGHEMRPLADMGIREGMAQETVYWKAAETWDSVTMWDPEGDHGARFVELTWAELCQCGETPWTDELFGDGEGPLVF